MTLAHARDTNARRRQRFAFVVFCLRLLRRALVASLAGIFVCASAAGLPPDVLSSGGLRAPVYEIPHPAGGANRYEGRLYPAGAYLVESDPYDLAANQPIVSFNVRNAADRSLLYRLDPFAAGQGRSDGAVFADTREFAIRVRDVVDGPTRIAIHDLASGTRRLVLTQPSAQPGDNFGSSVWFTTTRILVAAPGSDFRGRDAGAIYVFDRSTGRYVGTLGPGVTGGYFGSAPLGGIGTDAQLPGVPYVQVSGANVLIVHGPRAYRLARDRLETLALPRDSTLIAASIFGSRIILSIAETKRGRAAPGRVLAYDLVTGRLRYQLQGARLKTSNNFPTQIAASDDRLYVHDTGAGGEQGKAALHAFRLADGSRIASAALPFVFGESHDTRSLTFSANRLWLRTYTAIPNKASATTWIGYDPATLSETLRLTPPENERFVGPAPQPVGGGRLGVISARTTSGVPSMPIVPTAPNDGSLSLLSSSFSIGSAFTQTTVGVLIYDPSVSGWSHRLFLEGNFANLVQNTDSSIYDALLLTVGSAPHQISVARASFPFTEIADYDIALPDTPPATTLEGRLSYTLPRSYHYALHRSATPATEFTLYRELGLGDDTLHEDVVPYAETFGEVAYRLEGEPLSRRLSAPESDPLTIGSLNPSGLADFSGKVALSAPSGTYPTTPATVKLLDLTTRETLLTVFPGRNGSVALNERYLAVGDTAYDYAGKIDLYDATTGALLRSLNGAMRFGNYFALVGDRLVTTSVVSAYASGTYTHTSQVSTYSLPSGKLLYTRPLATLTNTRSWSHPPTDLCLAGDSIVVRTQAPDGTSADAGRIRVLSLATGDLRYELASPAPAPEDYFGSWLAAGGDYLAVGSSGTSEVFVFDLPTGELRHTLILADRPEGIVNYATSFPRLSIDAGSHRLSWFVSDDVEGHFISFGATAVYLFDLRTGLEEAKVLPPSSIGFRESFDGATLAGDRLLAPTQSGSLLVYPLTDALATPLAVTREFLAPTPVARLEFPTRRGISYQPEVSADAGSTWIALGTSHSGNGQPATLRRSLNGLPAAETLRFRLQPAWR